MPPLSPGRTPTYTFLELKQAWKDYRSQNPTGTKKNFSKVVGLSYSRVKAILNDHPSEQRRRNKKAVSQVQPKLNERQEPVKKKSSGLMFFPT